MKPQALIFALALFSLPAPSSLAQERRLKEIPLESEREVTVTVDVSFGTVIIEPGPAEKILVAEFTSPYRDEADDVRIGYSTRDGGRRGDLVIRSKDRSRFWKESGDKDIEDRVWRLQFSDRIPMEFKIELGAGKGELDLSGLRIRSFKVSSGASSVEMSCGKPNPIMAEIIVIESGVSKFSATDLANTNFRKLKFTGGVGAYRLDFGGTLMRDADAEVEVGLGAVTIDLPREMPVRLYYDDSWFSSFDMADGFTKRRGGVYETADVRGTAPALSLHVEAGLGSVKVRRR